MIISFTQRQEATNMIKGAFYFKYWVICVNETPAYVYIC